MPLFEFVCNGEAKHELLFFYKSEEDIPEIVNCPMKTCLNNSNTFKFRSNDNTKIQTLVEISVAKLIGIYKR